MEEIKNTVTDYGCEFNSKNQAIRSGEQFLHMAFASNHPDLDVEDSTGRGLFVEFRKPVELFPAIGSPSPHPETVPEIKTAEDAEKAYYDWLFNTQMTQEHGDYFFTYLYHLNKYDKFNFKKVMDKSELWQRMKLKQLPSFERFLQRIRYGMIIWVDGKGASRCLSQALCREMRCFVFTTCGGAH